MFNYQTESFFQQEPESRPEINAARIANNLKEYAAKDITSQCLRLHEECATLLKIRLRLLNTSVFVANRQQKLKQVTDQYIQLQHQLIYLQSK